MCCKLGILLMCYRLFGDKNIFGNKNINRLIVIESDIYWCLFLDLFFKMFFLG